MMKKKVLIVCPQLYSKGGVADYNKLISKYFVSNRISLGFFFLEDKSGKGAPNRIVKRIRDLVSLSRVMPEYDLIVLNPSLDAKAVVRDGVFNLAAKRIYNRKTLVIFHGWDPQCELLIDRYFKIIFRFVFNFDKGLVLADQFRNILIRWGFYPGKIALETTTYEEHAVSFDNDICNVVFLSRFVQEKGCMEAIRTIEKVTGEFPEVKLFMVGDGEMAPQLREYVSSHDLAGNVEFTGWLEGEQKYRFLSRCGIMLFPTYYGEGMPISVIEGMGMGLAVITRPIAGIRDIFADGENGFLIQSTEPSDFASKLRFLLRNKEVWQEISDANRRKAKEKFEIRNVVKRLELLYFELTQ